MIQEEGEKAAASGPEKIVKILFNILCGWLHNGCHCIFHTLLVAQCHRFRKMTVRTVLHFSLIIYFPVTQMENSEPFAGQCHSI